MTPNLVRGVVGPIVSDLVQGGGAEGGPTTIFYASFDAADGTAIVDYVPDVPADGLIVGGGVFNITSNQFAIGTPQASWTYAQYGLANPAPDTYTITFALTVFGDGLSAGQGLIFCRTSDTDDINNAYSILFFNDQIFLTDRNASTLDSAALAATDGDVLNFRIEVTPTAITGFVNDVELVSRTNTDHRGDNFGPLFFNSNNGGSADLPVINNLRVTEPA